MKRKKNIQKIYLIIVGFDGVDCWVSSGGLDGSEGNWLLLDFLKEYWNGDRMKNF